jgi:hypothetical protein
MDKDADGSSGFDVERVEDLERRLREREAHFDVVRPNRVVRELFSHTHTHTHTQGKRRVSVRPHEAKTSNMVAVVDTRKSRAMSDWLRMMNEWSR